MDFHTTQSSKDAKPNLKSVAQELASDLTKSIKLQLRVSTSTFQLDTKIYLLKYGSYIHEYALDSWYVVTLLNSNNSQQKIKSIVSFLNSHTYRDFVMLDDNLTKMTLRHMGVNWTSGYQHQSYYHNYI